MVKSPRSALPKNKVLGFSYLGTFGGAPSVLKKGPMSRKADLYELLDIPRSASADDIRLAYKRLALVCAIMFSANVAMHLVLVWGNVGCPPFKLGMKVVFLVVLTCRFLLPPSFRGFVLQIV